MVPVQEVALAHVVPHISYTGSYPLTPLIDGAAAPLAVDVDVVLWVPSAAAEGGGRGYRATIYHLGRWRHHGRRQSP
jgi:hypothetical protein